MMTDSELERLSELLAKSMGECKGWVMYNLRNAVDTLLAERAAELIQPDTADPADLPDEAYDPDDFRDHYFTRSN